MMDTIIFDIGRVLLEYKPQDYLYTKYSPQELAEALFEHVFSSEEWLELDRGTLDFKGAKEILGARIPHYREQVNEVLDEWFDIMKPIEGTVEIMNKLKEKNHKIYLLSNMNDITFDVLYEKYAFLREVEGQVISAHVKLLKPQREIYYELLKKYDLKPSQCVFIDDTKVNAEGAEKVGIKGIHFTSPEQLKKDLEELGLL